MSDLQVFAALAAELETEYRFWVRTRDQEKVRVQAETAAVALHTKVRMVAQEVAAKVQEAVHARIGALVSRCLAVFDNPYTFRVTFERKRGRTEAVLEFVRDGEAYDPTTEAGGGVVDVAAFALRVADLILRKPPVRKLLVLDEPFRFVSEGYRERVALLLEDLATEIGIQFVIVTHDPEFRIGRVIDLTRS